MDPFVRRLVERLLAPDQPLSRNRHFHTFDNAEGRRALKIRRRIEGLARAILAVQREGGRRSLSRGLNANGQITIALRLSGPQGVQTAYLDPDELELLRGLPGMAEALAEPPAP